jgi:hypothetical protein
MDRRDMLAGAAALGGLALTGAALAAAWDAGQVAHLLPTVSHERALLVVSLTAPQDRPPVLHLDDRQVAGRRVDTAGQHWSFDAAGLTPARRYALTLTDAAGRPLCDSWPLSTFPAPEDRPRHLRVLFYTCAGGHDLTGRFLPVASRARLLDRALALQPDVLVANGDHVYWDQRRQVGAATATLPERITRVTGTFDRSAPLLGTANEAVLKRAAGAQIAPLYGTRCRSVPVLFMQDDHDHFENDEATDTLITFPPDPFMLAAARATQRLYYPAFLPDPNRPLGLGSTRGDGLSESFGTLRYGRLLEVLMYDCRRFLTLHGPSARFVPETTEAWLLQRMAAGETAHLINAPSTPPGWSAGKWGEWYADLEDGAKLSTARPKPYWQPGWRAQHDRLLAAASAMRDRTPLFVSGDLHAIGEARIGGSGALDFSRHPVVSVLAGPLGTGKPGFPSFIRGMVPQVPAGLAVQEGLSPIEENGFLLADFTEDAVTLRYFKWRHDPEAAIDAMEPFRTTVLPRQ